LIKYIILPFFIAIFTVNALEIETIESFDEPQAAVVDIVESIDIKNSVVIEDNTILEGKTLTKEPTKKEINKKFKRVSKKAKKRAKKEQKEVAKVDKKSTTKAQKAKKSKKRRVQLAIIIDDVSQKWQIDFLKKLPYHITPSIFPPTKMNMHSNKLAKNLKHFMVHLPIESHSVAMNKIYKMLFLKDSNKKIRARVKEIRRLFPTAKYLNNHTGSVFSRNYAKCKVLYKALKQEGFIFLDSRTTQKSKFKKITKEMGDRYLKSDIYIDNTQSVAYTIKQLKKAIALAKQRGYAVVIGHPHPTTFKALKKAAKLFKNIDMVYIDELRF
jgi:polysaccharide deacetylase 2 family uncharacterized protein YibQ